MVDRQRASPLLFTSTSAPVSDSRLARSYTRPAESLPDTDATMRKKKRISPPLDDRSEPGIKNLFFFWHCLTISSPQVCPSPPETRAFCLAAVLYRLDPEPAGQRNPQA